MILTACSTTTSSDPSLTGRTPESCCNPGLYGNSDPNAHPHDGHANCCTVTPQLPCRRPRPHPNDGDRPEPTQ